MEEKILGAPFFLVKPPRKFFIMGPINPKKGELHWGFLAGEPPPPHVISPNLKPNVFQIIPKKNSPKKLLFLGNISAPPLLGLKING